MFSDKPTPGIGEGKKSALLHFARLYGCSQMTGQGEKVEPRSVGRPNKRHQATPIPRVPHKMRKSQKIGRLRDPPGESTKSLGDAVIKLPCRAPRRRAFTRRSFCAPSTRRFGGVAPGFLCSRPEAKRQGRERSKEQVLERLYTGSRPCASERRGYRLTGTDPSRTTRLAGPAAPP
jgi:hypothetical protein